MTKWQYKRTLIFEWENSKRVWNLVRVLSAFSDLDILWLWFFSLIHHTVHGKGHVSTGTGIACTLQLALLLNNSNCGRLWSPVALLAGQCPSLTHSSVLLIVFLDERPTTTTLQYDWWKLTASHSNVAKHRTGIGASCSRAWLVGVRIANSYSRRLSLVSQSDYQYCNPIG